MASKTTAFAIATFAAIALSGAAQASSFVTLGADQAASRSIVMLGEPAPAKIADDNKTTKADGAPDPMRTAAVVIQSRSIVTLGTPARDERATDPTERDEIAAPASASAEAPQRPDALPIVMRGDFGSLRGSGGESIPVQTAAPAEPAAPTGESAPAAAPAGGGGAPAGSGGSGGSSGPTAAKPDPQPQEPELSPAELDR